ncbi:MAG: hypothetical protein K8L91_04170 [Anaerolineae bacterium]|nr:hypothetical protein [Anaerolineae bacterium]
MRISIWQQFSSNHSSKFTIVGRFGTEQEAEAVANQLLTWMKSIIREKVETNYELDLTFTEQKIRDTYNLDWYENGIEWNGMPEPSEIVKRVDKVTLIASVN